MIVSGGMEGAEHVRWVFEHTGCAAVMLARGALGNPWLFEEVLGTRVGDARRRRRSSRSGCGCSIVPSSTWASERAASYLKKFHPWYVERLGAGKETQNRLQRADFRRRAAGR